jgi:tetratricopeptide (TPR) repeat protein
LHLRAASIYADQDPILHAQHLDRAGSPRSANAYLAAAQSELDRFRHEPALRLVQRGLELTTGPEAFALNMLSGELNHRLGNTDAAIEAYRIAQQHASSHEEACRALVGIAEGLRVKEDYSELLDVLDEAQEFIKCRNLPQQQARLCQLRASVHFVHGETAQCLSENKRSLEFAREAGSSELEAQALGNLADAEFSRGRMVSAHSLFDECVALSFKHNFSKVAAANISMRGQTLLYLGHPQKALADCEEALQLSIRQFNPRAELVARLVGTYTLELFDLKAGQEWAKAGAELAKKIGAGRFELVCIEYLGRLAALEGDGDLAEQLVGEAVTAYRASESSMRFLGGRALGSYALVCRDGNRRRELLLEGEEILKLGVGAHNPLWFYRDAIEVSLDLEDWAATAKYADRLESYASVEPLDWSRYFAARGRALAQHGTGSEATAVLQAVRARGAEIGYTYSLDRLDAVMA